MTHVSEPDSYLSIQFGKIENKDGTANASGSWTEAPLTDSDFQVFTLAMKFMTQVRYLSKIHLPLKLTDCHGWLTPPGKSVDLKLT
jgi:hypothetical protein